MENLSGPDNSQDAMQQRKILLQQQLEERIVKELHSFVMPLVFELPRKEAL